MTQDAITEALQWAFRNLRVTELHVKRDIQDRRGRFRPALIEYPIDEISEKLAEEMLRTGLMSQEG